MVKNKYIIKNKNKNKNYLNELIDKIKNKYTK